MQSLGEEQAGDPMLSVDLLLVRMEAENRGRMKALSQVYIE
jgi:hypothetical protein